MLTFIVTNFNYSKYLRQCLDTIIPQLSEDTRCVVVDDGSTDNSLELLRTYSSKYLKIIECCNSGIEVACNIGMLYAQSRYVCRVDADDVLEPDFVAKTRGSMEAGHDVIYGDYDHIDQYSNVTSEVFLPDFDKTEIQERGDFLATGTIVSFRALREAGFYSLRKRNCGLENFELILKLLHRNNRFLKLNEKLFRYRMHSASLSSTRRTDIINYGHSLATMYSLEKYTTNRYHPYGLTL